MTHNMGAADRGIRFVSAVAIAALLITGAIGDALAVVMGIVAVLAFATSLSGWCPLYVPFRISTRRATTASRA